MNGVNVYGACVVLSCALRAAAREGRQTGANACGPDHSMETQKHAPCHRLSVLHTAVCNFKCLALLREHLGQNAADPSALAKQQVTLVTYATPTPANHPQPHTHTHVVSHPTGININVKYNQAQHTKTTHRERYTSVGAPAAAIVAQSVNYITTSRI
jgi:hypothetical protein